MLSRQRLRLAAEAAEKKKKKRRKRKPRKKKVQAAPQIEDEPKDPSTHVDLAEPVNPNPKKRRFPFLSKK